MIYIKKINCFIIVYSILRKNYKNTKITMIKNYLTKIIF